MAKRKQPMVTVSLEMGGMALVVSIVYLGVEKRQSLLVFQNIKLLLLTFQVNVFAEDIPK